MAGMAIMVYFFPKIGTYVICAIAKVDKSSDIPRASSSTG
jgi:hypothetical protein